MLHLPMAVALVARDASHIGMDPSPRVDRFHGGEQTRIVGSKIAELERGGDHRFHHDEAIERGFAEPALIVHRQHAKEVRARTLVCAGTQERGHRREGAEGLELKVPSFLPVYL